MMKFNEDTITKQLVLFVLALLSLTFALFCWYYLYNLGSGAYWREPIGVMCILMPSIIFFSVGLANVIVEGGKLLSRLWEE